MIALAHFYRSLRAARVLVVVCYSRSIFVYIMFLKEGQNDSEMRKKNHISIDCVQQLNFHFYCFELILFDLYIVFFAHLLMFFSQLASFHSSVYVISLGLEGINVRILSVEVLVGKSAVLEVLQLFLLSHLLHIVWVYSSLFDNAHHWSLFHHTFFLHKIFHIVQVFLSVGFRI